MKAMRARGFAVLLVLAFVVLLTVLGTSFLVIMRVDRTSTQNYSQAAKAQELALSGLQEVLGDILMEIEAGSLNDGNPSGAVYTRNGVRVFMPANPQANIPMRIGFPLSDYGPRLSQGLLPPTLLRVSRAQDPHYDAPPSYYDVTKLPPNRASQVSTGEKSTNGRWISARRWNKHYLLGATVPIAFESRPPDWTYVTRGGSRVCLQEELPALKSSRNLTNSSQVLGRYAFAIYDEGGLLDINVAGYPSSLKNSSKDYELTSGKTAVAYADLTQLPGLDSKQTELDAFVQWRHKGSIALDGGFTKSIPRLMQDGFLKFGGGDSPLLSRQDLIGYFKEKVGTIEPLPFLGTFSRAVNAPVGTPKYPSNPVLSTPPAGYDYAVDAESETAVNRSLANVRFENTAVITHFKDDGTRDDYQATAGDPLLQRRFSLAKLAWLGSGGPKPEISQAAIEYCFGLRWTSPNGEMAGSWEYVAANTNAQIKTLGEVAAEDREPNFFELLKAGILSGSLGKDPGGRSTYTGGLPTSANTEGPAGLQFGTEANQMGYSEDKDRHILQIGANIIDQADSDSYPTAILFNVFPSSAPAAQVYNTLYGVENLPYITRLFLMRAEYPKGEINSWVQPELWNLHQAPPAAASGSRPTSFRIRSYGRANVDYYLRWGPGATKYFQTLGTPRNYDGADRESGIIYFTSQSGAAGFFYSKPLTLPKSQIDTNRTASTNFFDPNGLAPKYPANKSATIKDEYEFAGIWAGSVPLSADPWIRDPSDPDNARKGTNPWNATGPRQLGSGDVINDWHLITGFTPTTLTVSIECWDNSTSTWHPYCFISRLDTAFYSDDYDGNRKKPIIPQSPDTYFGFTYIKTDSIYINMSRPDPRTDRFSVGVSRTNGGPNAGAKFGGLNSMEPGDGNVFGTESRIPRTARGFNYSPASGSDFRTLSAWAVNQPLTPYNPYFGGAKYKNYNAYYSDADGVVRPGDSIYRDDSTGDGCLLFHSNFKIGSATARRPVILDRPFQSVGELGYVFRDLPMKSLDFFGTVQDPNADPANPEPLRMALTGDAALLELFNVTDTPPLLAGKINPNTAPAEVLQAIMSGTRQNGSVTPILTLKKADAETLATNIGATLMATPLNGASDIVGSEFLSALYYGYFDSSSTESVRKANRGNKAYFEAPVRALSAVANTRTWNLLIDVIAQSGRIPPNATRLSNFVVEGEKRYWLHVAIDRYSGKIVDQFLEPVYE